MAHLDNCNSIYEHLEHPETLYICTQIKMRREAMAKIYYRLLFLMGI